MGDCNYCLAGLVIEEEESHNNTKVTPPSDFSYEEGYIFVIDATSAITEVVGAIKLYDLQNATRPGNIGLGTYVKIVAQETAKTLTLVNKICIGLDWLNYGLSVCFEIQKGIANDKSISDMLMNVYIESVDFLGGGLLSAVSSRAVVGALACTNPVAAAIVGLGTLFATKMSFSFLLDIFKQ